MIRRTDAALQLSRGVSSIIHVVFRVSAGHCKRAQATGFVSKWDMSLLPACKHRDGRVPARRQSCTGLLMGVLPLGMRRCWVYRYILTARRGFDWPKTLEGQVGRTTAFHQKIGANGKYRIKAIRAAGLPAGARALFRSVSFSACRKLVRRDFYYPIAR